LDIKKGYKNKPYNTAYDISGNQNDVQYSADL